MKFFSIRFIPRGLLVALAALALVSCSDNDDDSPGTTTTTTSSLTQASTQASVQELVDAFASTLTGAEEVPPTPSSARGAGTVVVNASTRQMLATVTTSGLTGTAAHIHQAPPGVAGPIRIPLSETTPGSGIWTAQATLTEDQYNNLRVGNFYFNVHSAAFPEGEIRGQIVSQQAGATATSGTGTGTAGTGTTGATTIGTGTPATAVASVNTGVASTTSFLGSLKGQNEVPPTPSAAQGSGSAVVNPATRQLVAAITTTGMNATDAHIHEGAPGVNGPILIPFREASPGSGIWIANATLTEAQYAAMQQGNLYFNVHSAAFPNGEIRGQILPQMRFVTDLIPGTLTPAATGTPAATTPGTGAPPAAATGTTGATGAVGTTPGTTGTAGATATPGAPGTTGAATGTTGATGTAGATTAPGAPGTTGAAIGTTGATGTAGATAAPGAPGTTGTTGAGMLTGSTSPGTVSTTTGTVTDRGTSGASAVTGY